MEKKKINSFPSLYVSFQIKLMKKLAEIQKENLRTNLTSLSTYKRIHVNFVLSIRDLNPD